MSDDDEMLCDDDAGDEEEDYGFEYSDEDGEEAIDEEDDIMVSVENCYYTAKGHLDEGNTHKALQSFLQVLELEPEQGTWYFSSCLSACFSWVLLFFICS